MADDTIFHVTEPDLWDAAVLAGEYTQSTRGSTLDEIGFIHSSYADQVADIVQLVYADWTGELVLLEVDPTKVAAEIRVEAVDGGEAYPHIYGPLPAGAVRVVHRLAGPTDTRWRE